MTVAPDGRVFVCEQTGSLRVIKDDKLLASPFVTVAVDSTWGRGLIGVTFGPGFPKKAFCLSVLLAPSAYSHHRISRFTANGDVAAADSELVLLEGDDQTKLGGGMPNGHQGGAIHFGKDGKLYIAIGEQTAGLPAQNLDTFQGKLLRHQSRRHDSRGQPVFQDRQGQVPGHLGTGPTQSLYVCGATGHGPHFHQRRGRSTLGRNQRRGCWRELWLAPCRRAGPELQV